jgi:tRNA 2-thiouridine synthesizing protein A
MGKAGKTLDCRGKLCPTPLLETRRALESMDEGSLVVMVDALAAKENIVRAMLEAGNEALVEESEGQWTLTITKSLDQPLDVPEAAPTARATGPTVLLLLDRGLGRSDPDLGRILMKVFLTTLSAVGPAPASLILMQGGVRLACSGSDCLEPLRALAEQGANILACGTCLDYFGLVNALQVGRISNMAEIVRLLGEAGKVITV